MSDWQPLFEQWLQRAEDDIAILAISLQEPRVTDRVFGYHAQQATEKLLKAMIAAEEIEPRRIHDLSFLAATVQHLYHLSVNPLQGEDLTLYATSYRYPGFTPPGTISRPAIYAQVLRVRHLALDSLGREAPEPTI